MSRVEQYYDENPEREWERLERHRTELAVTLRALNEYLPKPPAAILDVGGGPGRYAITLARQGYRVTLLDLSSRQLDFARERAGEAGVGLADYVQADARDLSIVPDETYDAVLLMGPLYHLISPRERYAAVREARRVLREGGLIFASFITRYAPIRFVAKHDPAFILEHPAKLEELLTTGLNISETSGGFTDSYFALPTEIRPLMEECGFDVVDLIACEGVVSLIEEQINELTGQVWEEWVDLNFLLGKDPTIHGAAEHLLYVGRRW
jgi:S-adenosylmethionine-dependent methyltransferase